MTDGLISSDDLEKIKKDIALLKRTQGLEEPEEAALKNSISDLSRSISSLMNIFKEASDELKQDAHDAVLVSEKIDKIMQRIERIEIQNEKIAKGLVAVADMVEDLQISPTPSRPKIGPVEKPAASIPPPSQDFRYAKPLPQYRMPPQEEKKKGFFDSLTNLKI